MALHRDIYWVGKQWAVTGYGIQACDQKQKGQFDIEGSRLWEEGVQESLRAQTWLNAEDFGKAVSIARKYYPEPSQNAEPPQTAVFPPNVFPPKNEIRPTRLPGPVIEGLPTRNRSLSARFVPVWRIRTHLNVPGEDK
jgi:hypothetical protein